MAFKTDKFEFVELLVPGISGTGQTGTRFNFPDLPKLRYVNTQAIQCYNNTNVVNVSPSGYTNLADDISFQNAFLTLYCNERQDVWRVPLQALSNIDNNGVTVYGMWELKGAQIVWDKSYVEFGSAPGNTTNRAIFFGVYYA